MRTTWFLNVWCFITVVEPHGHTLTHFWLRLQNSFTPDQSKSCYKSVQLPFRDANTLSELESNVFCLTSRTSTGTCPSLWKPLAYSLLGKGAKINQGKGLEMYCLFDKRTKDVVDKYVFNVALIKAIRKNGSPCSLTFTPKPVRKMTLVLHQSPEAPLIKLNHITQRQMYLKRTFKTNRLITRQIPSTAKGEGGGGSGSGGRRGGLQNVSQHQPH